jgi:hypothetical protein
MLVAQVALDSGIMSASTIESAQAIIAEINKYFPNSPEFVTAGVWADDLKSEGNYLEANWHFIDLPVEDESNPPPEPPPAPPAENVAWAISEGSSTVRAAKSTLLDKSRQLRFMVHFVGDVHQPLHAASYFSEQFPDGDAGGNAWAITSSIAKNLHSFWDSGAGQWATDLPRPLSPASQAQLKTEAAALMSEHPASSFGSLVAAWPPTVWANESVELAATVAYTAPQAPTPIPDDYITEAVALCRKQVALAGYRLATQIEYTLGQGSSAEPKVVAWAREAEAQLLAAAHARRDGAPSRQQHSRLRAGAAA